MAKALGLSFNPELGLFNIYGDVGCQPSPDFSDSPEFKGIGEWTSLTLKEMTRLLRLYGSIAAREILGTGTLC